MLRQILLVAIRNRPLKEKMWGISSLILERSLMKYICILAVCGNKVGHRRQSWSICQWNQVLGFNVPSYNSKVPRSGAEIGKRNSPCWYLRFVSLKSIDVYGEKKAGSNVKFSDATRVENYTLRNPHRGKGLDHITPSDQATTFLVWKVIFAL